MILGLPWLVKNNPLINWTQETLQWPAENLNFEKVTTHFIDPIKDEENLHIYRAKLSETFHQMYGTEREMPRTIEDMVPREYYPYLAIFDKETSERFPPSRSCDHEINLKPDFKPKRIPPYSLNPEETKLAKEFIDENMAKGYIRESNSDMASPLFFVGKKDGSKRPCQDYRLLNEGTIKDSFPIPRITDLLRVLQKAKLFTKLDIRWGYNNIQIKEADRHKAAFSTPTGLYEPNVMFFGLCNSPATFQRMMNEIFEEEIFERWCLIYMDDILILSETEREDSERTIRILDKMILHNLFCKPEKCEFKTQKVEYLGFILEPGKISMDPKKLAGIRDWPSPKNLRQVRSFLGFGNFYRGFIREFSNKVRPLTELTKKEQPFLWGPRQEQVFQELKEIFQTAPVLAMPDPDKPFFVESDASQFAMGVVLMQRNDQGKLQPCGYISSTLSPAEQNYSIQD